MNSIDELLTFFCRQRSQRHPSWMAKPNEQKGYVYATNKHALVRIPKNMVGKYSVHKDANVFDKVINNAQSLPVEVCFKATDLLAILSKTPKSDDWNECVDCDGEGMCKCRCCSHVSLCEPCGGRGIIEDYRIPEIYVQDNYYINVCGSWFTPYIMGFLEKAIIAMQADEFTLTHGKVHGLHIFAVNGISVMLMPVMEDDIESWEDRIKHTLQPK